MKSTINLRKIVNILRSEGHSVTYYVRKDGGILIKSIDGQKFQGATGNTLARQMTGMSLSTKRAEQLYKITYTGKRPEAYIEDREIKNLLRRVQRKWNKAFPHKRGEFPSVGLKTAKKIKARLLEYGREETIKSLKEAERYATGLAYTQHIDTLIKSIEDYIAKSKDKHKITLLNELIAEIREDAMLIEYDGMYYAFRALYNLDDPNIPIEDVITDVRSALGLDKINTKLHK